MYYRGDIYLADLDPHTGREQAGAHPVLVISGNSFNTNDNLIIVMPLTSKIKNFYGGVVVDPDKQNGLTSPSEILTFHIRCISTERLIEKIGVLDTVLLGRIQEGLVDILTL